MVAKLRGVSSEGNVDSGQWLRRLEQAAGIAEGSLRLLPGGMGMAVLAEGGDLEQASRLAEALRHSGLVESAYVKPDAQMP